ncbi:MAG: hypothetical protein M2R45_01211 [Verrucomicrobia subdivision 3 bacterium]|nr:hypothetical protein [Limisphaerales bacterium]MCS1415237.1 hypothetical protein [Limisphaerales bacterium]
METEFIIWFQRTGAPVHWLLRALSEFGPSTGFGVLLSGLYWCWDYSAMSRVWFVNLTCSWLTGILKLSFHTLRPYWIEPEIKGLTHASGFGMPSGHSLVAAAVWGELGRHWHRLKVWILCGGLIAGVGISRIYLGVHSVAQVVVGISLGLGFLAFYPHLESKIKPGFLRLDLRRQLLVLLSCSVLACGVALLTRWLVSDVELPQEWVAMALEKRPEDGIINPFSLHSPIMLAGMTLGVLGGYRVLVVWKQDRNARDGRARILRFLLGGALVGPYVLVSRRLMRGEDIVVLPFAAALSVDYLYGLVTGLLVSLVMPLVFNRCRL